MCGQRICRGDGAFVTIRPLPAWHGKDGTAPGNAPAANELPESGLCASVRRRNHDAAAGTVSISVAETGEAGLGAVVTGLGLESPASETE